MNGGADCRGGGDRGQLPGWCHLSRWLLICAGLCLFATCRSLPDLEHPLTSIQEVRAQPAGHLRQVLPTRLEGVVTYLDERQRLMVIQDGALGLPIEIRKQISGINLGDRICVQGYTGYESFSPILIKPKISRLARDGMPPPLAVALDSLFRGEADFRRVELEGDVVSSVASGPGYFEMEVRAGGRMLHASGRFITPVPVYSLSGRRIRLRGVPVSTYTPSGAVFGVSIFASEDTDLQVIRQVSSVDGTPGIPPQSVQVKLPLLDNIWAVKSLRNLDAERGYPVKINGVITYWDPGRDHLFVQDATGASYVRLANKSIAGLEPGSRVEILGRAARGNFAPVIQPDSVVVLGKAPFPVPIKVRPGGIFYGREENLWAEVEGVIQRWDVRYLGQARLLLASGQSQVTVAFAAKPSDQDLDGLVDRRVRVQGVYSPIFSLDQRLLGFELRAPSLSQVEVLSESAVEKSVPELRSIHGLMEYSPSGIPEHRVKVEGRITQMGSEGSIFVEDGTGGIRVEGAIPETLNVGDGVQVMGFIRWVHSKAILQNVQVHPVPLQMEVRPLSIAADTALSGVHDGRLVQMEGFLREETLSFGDRVLALESGRKTFTAILENPHGFPGLDRLRAGALVRLVGVCDVTWDEAQNPPVPTDIRLRLRTPADIAILKSGPFWTLRRALILMAVLLGILGTATVFLILLQKRVKARTEQLKQQMDHRSALEDQLRQAQKLEGVGRLAGGVAHDFNNLLTVINGYCEMLLADLDGQKAQQECAQQIARAGERAMALTKQLLAFSRKQILQPVVLDLNQLVSDMDKMLRRLITEDIQFSTRISREPCLIKVDPGQMGQVLMNLAVNAKDAMPAGGQLVIEVDPVFLDAEVVRKRPDMIPGSYVRLTVSDTGNGMDAQILEKIFEPFFTTKEPGKGTGLGLSTVFGIVKQSGGHIWVYSEPGQGSSFKLFFPRVEDGSPERVNLSGEAEPGGGETVLVVEDQEEVRRLVCNALESRGYCVLSACDGEEALRVSSQHEGVIHLLVTDVVMPGLNGPELAKRLVEDRAGLKVLYMSGYTEDVMVHKGLLEKSIDLIQKPFGPRELAARVAEVLERRGA